VNDGGAWEAAPRPAGLATATLCLLALVGPQLLGGAVPWSIPVISGLAVLALFTAIFARRRSGSDVVDALAIAMMAAWLWTCVQALALPAWVARPLGLRSVEAAERLEGLSWIGNIPFTISYDPGSTYQQIMIGVAVVATFLAARLAGPSTLRPLAIATVASALLLTFEAFIHRAVHADAVFGIYTPRFAVPRLLTPLMNGNHLGGFSVLGAVVSAGLAASARPQSRIGWILASIGCSITAALSLSRGAIGALFFGFGAWGAWLLAARSRRRQAVLPVALAAAALAGITLFFGLGPFLRRFENQGFDKLAVAARGLRLLDGSNWWLGVGRGAFSAAFASQEGSRVRYTHPENLPVQWLTEWGIPVALALLVIVTIALLTRLRSSTDALVSGVCIALAALSLQNLVDFSLEMAGIVVVASALLGAAVPAKRSWPRARGAVPVVALVFVVTFLAVGPRIPGSDTQSIIDNLVRSMKTDDQAAFQAELQRSLALHPGEPTLALLAGAYAGSKGHEDAPRWLSVAMQEAPGWAAPHVVAAQLLVNAGRVDQALVEIRAAEQRQPGSGQDLLCTVLSADPRMASVERAAPDGDLRVAFLDRATTCPSARQELRAEIDTMILQIEPGRPSVALREARRLLSRGRTGDAAVLLEGAVNDNPNNASLWSETIRAHLKNGNPGRALDALERAKRLGVDGRTLTAAEARIQAALGETDEMRATLTRLRGRAKGDPRLVAQTFTLEAELEAALGNLDEALSAYEAADTVDPTLGALHHAAALAVKSGRPSQGRRIYHRLCLREPGGRACAEEQRLDMLRRHGGPEK
jgi:tetratricopeptide (TPR) repeat protein